MEPFARPAAYDVPDEGRPDALVRPSGFGPTPEAAAARLAAAAVPGLDPEDVWWGMARLLSVTFPDWAGVPWADANARLEPAFRDLYPPPHTGSLFAADEPPPPPPPLPAHPDDEVDEAEDRRRAAMAAIAAELNLTDAQAADFLHRFQLRVFPVAMAGAPLDVGWAADAVDTAAPPTAGPDWRPQAARTADADRPRHRAAARSHVHTGEE